MSDIIISILFIVISVMVPILTVVIMPYAGISLKRFSLKSLFVIYYITFAYMGIIVLYFGLDTDRIAGYNVTDKLIILEMLFYSSISLLVIICSFAVCRQSLGIRSLEFNFDTIEPANDKQRIFIGVLFLVSVLVLILYVRKLESIALFKAISGDIAGAAMARSNMGSNFEGSYWRYKLFFRTALNFCLLFYFVDFLKKKSFFKFTILLISFAVAAFSSVMAIEKGPIAELLITLFLGYIAVNGGHYWQKVTKYFCGTIFLLLIFAYIYFMGVHDFSTAIVSIASRIFTGQITPAYFYISIFPAKINYLMGSSLPNPAGIFPFEHFRITIEVAKYIFSQDLFMGVSSAPTVYWAEMYANFGVLGVIFSSMLVGICFFALSLVLQKLPMSIPAIIAIISISMICKELSTTGITHLLFSADLFFIIIVSAILFFLNQNWKNKSLLQTKILGRVHQE